MKIWLIVIYMTAGEPAIYKQSGYADIRECVEHATKFDVTHKEDLLQEPFCAMSTEPDGDELARDGA